MENDPTTPIISIVTTVKNGELTLSRSIESVIYQSTKEIEFIVIDADSSDTTPEIITHYSKRIQKITREPDQGLYFGMNKGFNAATGTFIAFLGADDYYEPRALVTVLGMIENNPKVDVIYSAANLHSIVGLSPQLLDVSHQELQDRMIPHPTMFIRRELAREFGYFDVKYQVAADYDLALKLFTNGANFMKSKIVLTNIQSGGFSSRYRWISCKETLMIQRNYAKISHSIYIYRLMRRWLRVQVYEKTLSGIVQLWNRR